MRKAFIILLAMGVLISVAACGNKKESSQQDNVTVRVGVLRGADALTLSEKDGPLQKQIDALGAKLEKTGNFPALAPAIEALSAGSVDITVGSITAAASALVGGTSDFTIFARQESDYKTTGIVAKPESGIKDPSDLKGKKVAVNRGGTGEYLLHKALDKAGLTVKDVEVVYLPPNEAGPAFGDGKVDAWATWGSFTSLAEEKFGAQLVIPAASIDTQNDVVFIVRTAFLKDHPQVVRAFYEGLHDEVEQLGKNLDQTTARIKKAQNVSDQVARQQAETTTIPVESIDSKLQDRWQGIADYVFQNGIIPKAVDIKAHTLDVQKLN